MRALILALFAVCACLGAALSAPSAGAQTASDGRGLLHLLQVLDRAGLNPTADGATVIVSRLIGREERERILQTGQGPQPCARLTVSNGRAELEPRFNSDCPVGAAMSVAVDYNDGQPPIGAQAEPPIEWRPAALGESPRSVVVRPDQPRTAAEAGAGPEAAAHAPSQAGLRHVFQVLNRGGAGPASDGAVLYLGRLFSREERAQLEREGRTPSFCAVLTVRAGIAEVLPQFTADCPEGSTITATLDLRDGGGLIAADLTPQVQWRTARAGETAPLVFVRPRPPRTAGDADGIQPPATGETRLNERDASRTFEWGYAAVGVGLVLAAASVLVAILSRASARS